MVELLIQIANFHKKSKMLQRIKAKINIVRLANLTPKRFPKTIQTSPAAKMLSKQLNHQTLPSEPLMMKERNPCMNQKP